MKLKTAMNAHRYFVGIIMTALISQAYGKPAQDIQNIDALVHSNIPQNAHTPSIHSGADNSSYNLPLPSNRQELTFNVDHADHRLVRRAASCPVTPANDRIAPAGLIMNDWLPCTAVRYKSHNDLPFYSINGTYYNNRSISRNYSIDYFGVRVHRFNTEMNNTCLHCVRGDDTNLAVMPGGIRPNTHYTIVDGHCSTNCPHPYVEGLKEVTDFHQSTLSHDGESFEFATINNISGCNGDSTREVLVDMCGSQRWALDDTEVVNDSSVSVPVGNADFPGTMRYVTRFMRNADNSICAVDRTVNTISPYVVKTEVTANNNGEGDKFCIDIPTSPYKATQYILATSGKPDGSCSCNLVGQDYLDACSCQIGLPRMEVNNGTHQLCLTNTSGDLNDSVVFITRDTDMSQDSYKCYNRRIANTPDIFRHYVLNHSMILGEYRIHPSH